MNNMMMCSNCHKRLAVVFVTRIENGEQFPKNDILTMLLERESASAAVSASNARKRWERR